MKNKSLKEFQLEIKEMDDEGNFSGHAAVFGNVDLKGDIIQKGAFKKTIKDKNGKIPILLQHNPSNPIGIGQIKEDAHGLKIEGKLSLGVQAAKEAFILLKDKVIDGLSIGFDVIKDDFEGRTRILKEIRLWEVSLVTFPANPLATVTSVKDETPEENEQSVVKMKHIDKKEISAFNETIEFIKSLHNQCIAEVDKNDNEPKKIIHSMIEEAKSFQNNLKNGEKNV